MKLPKEYRKYIGHYSRVSNKYARRMLRKFGHATTEEVTTEETTTTESSETTTQTSESTTE